MTIYILLKLKKSVFEPCHTLSHNYEKAPATFNAGTTLFMGIHIAVHIAAAAACL
jgi:hypothetical protein